MARIGMHEAKTHLSQLVERALDGEEILLTRRGEAAVRLVPERGGGGFGSLAGVWRDQVKSPDGSDQLSVRVRRAVGPRASRPLLDTHLVLWWMAGEVSRISKKALATLGSERFEPVVSAVSIWEAAIKRGLGKLDAPADLLPQLERAGVEVLPVTGLHADLVASLPPHHRDPFDRLLVAQAMLEGVPLVSDDKRVRRYEIEVIW